MERALLIMVTIISCLPLVAQQGPDVTINGYTQVRMETDYKSNPNFYIRRARLWLDGHLPVKAKGEFVYRTKFYFTKGDAYPRLMDAKVGYKYQKLTIWVGQQVPDFGRQIIKGDAKIPLGERARYNYYLAPGEEGLLRDIGVQVFYSLGDRGHVSVGYFNGYFGNRYQKANYNLMLTHRLTYSLYSRGDNFVDVGYSFMYRRARDLPMPKLFLDSFTGRDLRYELEFETRFFKTNVEMGFAQAFLRDVEKQQFYRSQGFYANINQYFTKKDIGIIGVDYLQLPGDKSLPVGDVPWFILGYSRLFHGDKVKLSVNQWVKYDNSSFDTFSRIQFQVFIK